MSSGSDPPGRHVSRRRQGLWPVAAYLVVTLIVTTAEYASEMSKIGRGTYTDTFSPFLFTELLTLPVSAAHSAWGGYPAQFSTGAYRHALRSAVAPVIFGIVLICTHLHRHGHNYCRPGKSSP